MDNDNNKKEDLVFFQSEMPDCPNSLKISVLSG